MPRQVHFRRPFDREITGSDVRSEFAIAVRDDADGWVLGAQTYASRRAAEADLPVGAESVVIVR